MKMISAASADTTTYFQYARNCNLPKCRRPFLAPVPNMGAIQLFINMGINKPAVVEFKVIDLCNQHPVQMANYGTSYIIAHNGSYWYGVFKKLTVANEPTSYLILATVTYESGGTLSFISEEYANKNSCEELTKISVCYPSNYNTEDTNDIYIGAPSSEYPYAGNKKMIYEHNYWVRQGEVAEIQTKATYTSNALKNFRTVLNKIFELRSELVPGWYKDYLLAVYFRGNFKINDSLAIASDLAIENVEEDSDLWKANVKITKEFKGSFGCNDIECPPCIAPILPIVELPEANTGQGYLFTIPLDEDINTPFELIDITKPDWLGISITGAGIKFLGIPGTGDEGPNDVSFKIKNECGNTTFSGTINVNLVECVAVGMEDIEIPDAVAGLNYNVSIPLTGTAPFYLSAVFKPFWMNISISGNNVILSGTPSTPSTGITVAFTVNNCIDDNVEFSQNIDVNTGLITIENAISTSGNYIHGLTPIGWTAFSSVFVGPSGSINSSHGNYSGIITINAVVTLSSRVEIYKNGSIYNCIGHVGTGAQSYSIPVSFVATDNIVIILKGGDVCP